MKYSMFILLVIVVILTILYYQCNVSLPRRSSHRRSSSKRWMMEAHEHIVNRFWNERQAWESKLSVLGKILFLKNDKTLMVPLPRNFTVLVWKYYKILENRHIYNYGSNRLNPLRDCSVKNCIISGSDNDLGTADAVVVHLQRGTVPNTTHRPPWQRWVFLSDEAPGNTFLVSRDWAQFQNLFNWSMTYRLESDIPVPYGRTVPLENPIIENYSMLPSLIPYWDMKQTDTPATILMSNCYKDRMDFVKNLMQYINVDFYGSCSEDKSVEKCEGSFKKDCHLINSYYFYLAFENAECQEYITEKAFYNAYSKGAIPVILGSSESSKYILPPDSYILLSGYDTDPEKLAKQIKYIAEDKTRILKFHKWRAHFKVLNEHGYFGTPSVHYCRICEALNFNSVKEKVYDRMKLGSFLDPSIVCKR